MERVAPVMPQNLRRVLSDLLKELNKRLEEAMTNLDSVMKQDALNAAAREAKLNKRLNALGFGLAKRARARAHRAEWVWKKDAIDAVIQDLNDWHGRWDPSWFLLIKIANPVIDEELRRAKDAETSKLGVDQALTVAGNPLTVASNLRDALRPKPSVANLVRLSSGDENGGVGRKRSDGITLGVVPMEKCAIPYSEAYAARRISSASDKWYIVDTIKCRPSTNVAAQDRDLRSLARKLKHADPVAFGLLQCKGVVYIQHPQPETPHEDGIERSSPRPGPQSIAAFQFIFHFPDDMPVLRSLRDMLLNTDEAQVPLSRRLSIGRELAKAVSYVHTFAFVHKNIRPESVLCFEEDSSRLGDQDETSSSVFFPAPTKSHACLVGFDAFRVVDGGTLLGGDLTWERNVYRHPLRQGTNPTEVYRMHHDVYSLGVCLLELGLWESFVEYRELVDSDSERRTKLGKVYNDFCAWLKKIQASKATDQASQSSSHSDVASLLKDYLVEQARTRLPSRMGERYATVVLSCLTCTDDGNDEDLAPFSADEDIELSLRFNENILQQLDEIHV
jgi:serine/threonine protein kinase